MTDPLVEMRGGARVGRDEAREALLERLARLIAAEVEHDPVREPQLPGVPGRQRHVRRLRTERCDELAEREVAARDLALGPGRAGELRQPLVRLGVEELAVAC